MFLKDDLQCSQWLHVFPMHFYSCYVGKSSLLAALAAREVPIPDHIDSFLLRREMPPSDKTALQSVVEVDDERRRLEKEAEELAHNQDPGFCSSNQF